VGFKSSVGTIVGPVDGERVEPLAKVGNKDGLKVGVVGTEEGVKVGAVVATGNPIVGRTVGFKSSVGTIVGPVDGERVEPLAKVGERDGLKVGVVGTEEGVKVGRTDGTGKPIVGRTVGFKSSVGASVGFEEGG
jgi:hypothetical protein